MEEEYLSGRGGDTDLIYLSHGGVLNLSPPTLEH